MPESATPQEMNLFVKSVDDFFANYAKLISPQMRADVYASGNSQLIAEYNASVSRGAALKVTIERTTGAWQAAKAGWATVTGITSTVIGDAIDEIRSWFGYSPAGCYGCELGRYDVSPITGGQLGFLGAIQLPAAAWVAGILGAVYLANQAMTKIFVSVQATKIQTADPTVSRSRALADAAGAVKGISLFEGAALPLIAAAALAAFLIFGKK